jgi:CheY-like chemotaxis protein
VAKSPAFRKADILLAEDEPIVRKFVTAALTKEGYRIFQACDGLEAILLWHERRPIDLIMADVNMPGLAGPLLAEAIWVEEYTPVLYISGLPPGGLAARHIQDGRARFLGKPFQVGALRKNVQELVEIPRAFKTAH